jgi:hypothetical protein
MPRSNVLFFLPRRPPPPTPHPPTTTHKQQTIVPCPSKPSPSGGDYEAPFQCPLDFMLDVQALDWQHIQYRPAGFLDLPQVGSPRGQGPWH